MEGYFFAYFSKNTNIIFNEEIVYGFNYINNSNQAISYNFSALSSKFIQKAFRGINCIENAEVGKLHLYKVSFLNDRYATFRLSDNSFKRIISLSNSLENFINVVSHPDSGRRLISNDDLTYIITTLSSINTTLLLNEGDSSNMKNITNVEIYNTIKSNMEKGNEVFYNGKSIKLVHIKYDTLLGERVLIVDDTKDEYICNNTDLSSITISTKLFK